MQVLEKNVNSRGQARLKTALGWVSLVARDGTVLLEDMKDPAIRGGMGSGDQLEQFAREDLAADMTAWLLNHPYGDYSAWVADSVWVKSLGSNPHGPCLASRCWSKIFDEQKRQMDLVPGVGTGQLTDILDFNGLRELGRQWAIAPVGEDEDSAAHEPLTAPATMPDRSTDRSDIGLAPATWSDARDAAGSMSAPAREGVPKSAAVSTVSSPQSDVIGTTLSPLPGAFGRALDSNQPSPGQDNDRGETGADASEEWTHVDTNSWCSNASPIDGEHRVDEWEIVDTE